MSSENTLRTLKDLKFNVTEKDKDMRELIEMIQYSFHKDLREEAVKRVKLYIKRHMHAVAYEFKQFFNLTEEDLE